MENILRGLSNDLAAMIRVRKPTDLQEGLRFAEKCEVDKGTKKKEQLFFNEIKSEEPDSEGENNHQKALAHVGRDKMFHHLKDKFPWQGIQPVKNGMLQPNQVSYPFVEYEAEKVARKILFCDNYATWMPKQIANIRKLTGKPRDAVLPCDLMFCKARNAETDDTEEQQRERRINYFKEQYDKIHKPVYLLLVTVTWR
ncbi:hypothetical protein BpHYR1_031282 [Brachionus plicatilis]|uniref:Uncharacterized protein n=1 Tax=Brachionus plicatilis TaxID=10195 RepID=A0A3M7T1P2_BRAPC|nr:hypothetical protein BpHYR1_031282 [Brachionus plicatilis]